MGTNRITKVAIVGAGGNSASFMTAALLKTGQHTITALTRADSKTTLPEGVIVKKVDYTDHTSLVEALKGQEALVITLGGLAPRDTAKALIDAACEAGVAWILPNEWGPDTANEALCKDVVPFQSKLPMRQYISDLGKSSYISVSTGFWYEWSLAIPSAYGIDLINHTAVLFDEGETKITTSTWPQVGRAVAAILSLPIKPEGNEKDACLEALKNKYVYISSFTVSQKEMLASAIRATGTNESDWTITKEAATERYTQGLEGMKTGDGQSFAKMMYTRVFYSDGCGNVEGKTINALLGLPQEDIDEASKRAVQRAKTNPWGGS